MFKKHALAEVGGSSSKAAAILTRGAHSQYVSTAKGRPTYAKPLRQAWNRWPACRSLGEGWRLFSTFPLEFRQASADTQGMSVSMFTVKPDLAPHDQLRLLEAWDAWGIPRDQQRDWHIQLFGPDFHSHLSDYMSYETLHTKDDQLELPFDTEFPDHPEVY